MANAEPPSVPDFVLDDLDERTIKRYLAEADFRRAILSDPAACNEAEGLGLSDRTIAWINDRVGHHGLLRLLGELAEDLAPM